MKKLKSISRIINLKDKIALITGAGSGIGRAMAKRFAEAGANLYILDINPTELQKTAELLQKYQTKVEFFIIDLAKKDEIDKFWTRIKGKSPNILVNNAGIYPFTKFTKITPLFYQKVMDINLNSMLWMCQYFIKERLEKGGIIINISSIEALLPFKEDLAPYSISKAGVIALTRSLAREYGKKHFRVNAILPGAIHTPGTKTLINKAIRELSVPLMATGYNFKSRLALRRWGTPDEVAKMTLVLASELSSYVQGALIPVDGGFLSS